MSKKITKQEFYNRFYNNYPNCKINVIKYTAISNPAIVKCLKCGKILKRSKARQFLDGFDCCGAYDETRLEKAKRKLANTPNFIFIKQIDRDNIIVKHLKCGQEIKRQLNSVIDNPTACKFCNTAKINNLLSIQDVQKQIDTRFNGDIKILEYNGQLVKNKYRCLKCGKIWTQKQICIMRSNGCPECDRFKSMGEKYIAKLLDKNNILFQEQYYVKELPRQHFDFAILNNKHNVEYFIEVNGDQHYYLNDYFKTPFEVQQKRDNKKREYCKKQNIPLYELKYHRSKILNLDILPFIDSTTISAKESTI